MGIQGLGSFIKNRVPQTIKPLRLFDLQQRTVAIDGNVLTLKFHHSYKYQDELERQQQRLLVKNNNSGTVYPSTTIDSIAAAGDSSSSSGLLSSDDSGRARTTEEALEKAQANKVILSWYRFLRNLGSYGIKPIVVFDGSKRISAKTKELERRFNARKLLSLRAENEQTRVERLTNLHEVVTNLRALDPTSRDRTLNETHRIIGETPPEAVQELSQQQEASPDLSTRFAGLVMNFQATQVKEEGVLSKRQLAIARDEAQAFTRALATSVITEEAVTELPEEPEVDALDALQTILDDSKWLTTNYTRRSTGVSKQTYTDCMEVIKMMGIPVLLTSATEPQEAESLCSSLVFAEHANLVITEDTDVLAFSAPMLRHIGAVSREGDRIDGAQVRAALGIPTQEAWIDFCLLCGCDFTERIKGLGPVGAYNLIMQYGSIEEILKSDALYKGRKSVQPPLNLEAYMVEITAARAVFLSPVPLDSYAKDSFDIKEEDPALMGVLENFGLTEGWEIRNGFFDPNTPATDEAFEALTPLDDSPHIPGAQYIPSPGIPAGYKL